MAEPLTADELAILRAAELIRARERSVSVRGALGADGKHIAAPETEQEAERARYDAEIAERDERLARDPAFQEMAAAWRRHAEEEHKQELARLKALAKLTAPPDPRPPMQVPPGWTMLGGPSARFTCWECALPIWGEYRAVGVAGQVLCTPCDARHQLRCDQCGRHGDVITTLCTDQAYRCDACMEHIQDVPAERKLKSAVGVRR